MPNHRTTGGDPIGSRLIGDGASTVKSYTPPDEHQQTERAQLEGIIESTGAKSAVADNHSGRGLVWDVGYTMSPSPRSGVGTLAFRLYYHGVSEAERLEWFRRVQAELEQQRCCAKLVPNTRANAELGSQELLVWIPTSKKE